MRVLLHSVCTTGLGVAVALLAAVSSAVALDPAQAPPADQPSISANPSEAFRVGAKAYFAGDKAAAADAFGSAADLGHPLAQWKLGRMYQEGDGVDEDDYKAFQLFSEVANSHADDAPSSAEAPFVASAFVELGEYYLRGIKDTAVEPNVARARELFTYAASYFGDASAQYQLGRLYLEGQDGGRDPQNAARWLKLAAMKGHPGAQALLGEMLVEGDDLKRDVVMGLMWLTVARTHPASDGEDWIRDMQEQAFSLATERERRKATELADAWIAANRSH
jgi:TPR repeat protein